MKSLKHILMLCLLSSRLYAQGSQAEVTLPQVSKEGFYRIPLTPDLGVFLTHNFANLRLVDQAGQQVPYLHQEEIPVRYTQEFQEYGLEKKVMKGCCTELILKNPDRHPINNVRLLIRNAEVTKYASLLGSDDRVNWFALRDKFILQPVDGGNGTHEVRLLDFPMSNYLYYSLRINDSTSAPLNILKAGYYAANLENGQYTDVPLKVLGTDNKGTKETRLWISFDTLRWVDRLDVTMKGDHKYFMRSASLVESKERKLKHGKRQKYESELASFELTSSAPARIDLTGSRLHHVQLIILNQDNPPLELVSVKAWQLNRFAVAWLKPGQTYTVVAGPATMDLPLYDLRNFADSIPKHLSVLELGPVRRVDQKSNGHAGDFFSSKGFIWSAMAIVAVFLGFMATKMVREMGKTEKGV